jgi:hypothetical protein
MQILISKTFQDKMTDLNTKVTNSGMNKIHFSSTILGTKELINQEIEKIKLKCDRILDLQTDMILTIIDISKKGQTE